MANLLYFVAKLQNIYNLIGREDYNIDHIVLSVSLLHSLKKSNHAEI